MRKYVTSVAALAIAAVTLAAAAAGGSNSAKQRVAISHGGTRFVLTPLTSGALQRDSGVVTFCCWSSRHVVRNGKSIEVNDPRMTLTGKRGALVARNRIEWVDVGDGWSVFTGTWKIVHGTGDYAELSGGGLAAGIKSSSGDRARFVGSVGSK